MRFQLNVTPLRQETNMSCWWYATRMVFEYYGLSHRYPSDLNPEFSRPWQRPVTPLGDHNQPSAQEIERELRANNYRGINDSGLFYLLPYEWYTHGLPNDFDSQERYCRLTGMRGLHNTPPDNRWDIPLMLQNLRSFGPLVFMINNHGSLHDIVVVGVDDITNEIILADPWWGTVYSISLASFKQQFMNTRTVYQSTEYGKLNPFYYPTSQPVRGTLINNTST